MILAKLIVQDNRRCARGESPVGTEEDTVGSSPAAGCRAPYLRQTLGPPITYSPVCWLVLLS